MTLYDLDDIVNNLHEIETLLEKQIEQNQWFYLPPTPPAPGWPYGIVALRIDRVTGAIEELNADGGYHWRPVPMREAQP